jgi:hypothetical protein
MEFVCCLLFCLSVKLGLLRLGTNEDRRCPKTRPRMEYFEEDKYEYIEMLKITIICILHQHDLVWENITGGERWA